MLEKPKFLDRVKVKEFSYSWKNSVKRGVSTFENKKPDQVFTVIGVTHFNLGNLEYYDNYTEFKKTGQVQVFIVANTIGVRHKVRLEDLEPVNDL